MIKVAAAILLLLGSGLIFKALVEMVAEADEAERGQGEVPLGGDLAGRGRTPAG